MKLRVNPLRRASRAWRVLWLLTACALVSLPPIAQAQPVQTITVTVVAVDDSGERLDVVFRGGQRETVRLKGVRVLPCIREESLAEIRELTWARVVFLELSSNSRDPDTGHLAGYLWADAVMINEHLVARGLAAYTGEASRYQRGLRESGEAAQASRLGYHGRPCPA